MPLPTEFFENIQKGIGGIGPGLLQQQLMKQQQAQMAQQSKFNMTKTALTSGYRRAQPGEESAGFDLFGTGDIFVPIAAEKTPDWKEKLNYEHMLRMSEFDQKTQKKELARLQKESNVAKSTMQQVEALMGRTSAQWKGSKGELEKTVGGLGKYRPFAVARTALGEFVGDELGAQTALSGAYDGQLSETTFTLNRLITGQNRVIRSVTELIRKTLPSLGISDRQFKTKISQSLQNAYALTKARRKLMSDTELNTFIDGLSEAEKAELSTETNEPLRDDHPLSIKLKGLTPSTLTAEEQKIVDSMIERVLKVAPATVPLESGEAAIRGAEERVRPSKKSRVGRFEIEIE
jgi:hypothetical protein